MSSSTKDIYKEIAMRFDPLLDDALLAAELPLADVLLPLMRRTFLRFNRRIRHG